MGEAPGAAENSLGRPFVGPAGLHLDLIIQQSGLIESGIPFALTNLVGCLPTDEYGTKDGQPDDTDIRLCQSRLEEFIELCHPKVIITVGTLARDYLDQKYMPSFKYDRSIKLVEITHPAAILRMPYAQSGLATKRCTIILAKVVDDLLTQKVS